MAIEDAVRLALERARLFRVDPQLTMAEMYEAELLRCLQQKVRAAVVWKGGTALRLEGSERFSRDLDATRRSASLSARRLKNILAAVGAALPHIAGLEINPQAQAVVAAYRLLVPGLQQPLRIRVEVSLRERVLRTPTPISTARIAHPVGIEPVVVARLESAELLAEKVRALVTRLTGRDIYDVYWLLQRGVDFHPRLFLRKIRYYEKIGRPVDPVAAVEKAAKQLDTFSPSRAKTELANLFPASQRNLDFAIILQDMRSALKSWLPLVSSAVPRKENRTV